MLVGDHSQGGWHTVLYGICSATVRKHGSRAKEEEVGLAVEQWLTIMSQLYGPLMFYKGL